MSVTIGVVMPEKMKSHSFKLVSKQNSLLNMHRSHRVKCSSGATSFDTKC